MLSAGFAVLFTILLISVAIWLKGMSLKIFGLVNNLFLLEPLSAPMNWLMCLVDSGKWKMWEVLLQLRLYFVPQWHCWHHLNPRNLLQEHLGSVWNLTLLLSDHPNLSWWLLDGGGVIDWGGAGEVGGMAGAEVEDMALLVALGMAVSAWPWPCGTPSPIMAITSVTPAGHRGASQWTHVGNCHPPSIHLRYG